MRAHEFISEEHQHTRALKDQDVDRSHDRVDYVIYVNKKPATVYDTLAQAKVDLDAVKQKYPGGNIVIKRRVKSVRHDDVVDEAMQRVYQPHNPDGLANWREFKRAQEYRGPQNDSLHDAKFKFDGVVVPLEKSSSDFERLYKWCKNHLGNNEHTKVFDRLGNLKNLDALLRSMRPPKAKAYSTEDVSSTPGGVGSGTKMVMEKDVEAQPRVRRYENSRGERRWEVLDWQGVRHGPEFTHRRRAHEYLERNRERLEEPLDEDSNKFTQFIPPSSLTGKWIVTYIPKGEKEAINAPYSSYKSAVKGQNQLKDAGHQIIRDFPIQQTFEDSATSKWDKLPKVWKVEYVPRGDVRKENPAHRRLLPLYYADEKSAFSAAKKLRDDGHDSRTPAQVPKSTMSPNDKLR